MTRAVLNSSAGCVALLALASTMNATAGSASDPNTRTIERLFEITASSNGTVADAKSLFEDLEMEMDLALQVHFPRRLPQQELSAKEEAFILERVAHPSKYRSELLRCLRLQWPQFFGRMIGKPHVVLAGAPKGPVRYRATIDGEDLYFLFGMDRSVIVSIVFPDGTTLDHAVARCSEKGRGRAEDGGAR